MLKHGQRADKKPCRTEVTLETPGPKERRKTPMRNSYKKIKKQRARWRTEIDAAVFMNSSE